MIQNAIYICISWYSKICWFLVKKYWCQQNSRGVSRDSYIFWIFFGWGITVPRFIIVGFVWQILVVRRSEQPRKSPSWIGLNTASVMKYLTSTCPVFPSEMGQLGNIVSSTFLKRIVLSKIRPNSKPPGVVINGSMIWIPQNWE